MLDRRHLVLFLAGALWLPAAAEAQQDGRTLVRSWDVGPSGPLPWDQGSIGVWQRLQKLGTTASLLYTTGHPDDEEAGVLTLLSRGEGVRTALLTLNRGEGGANAVGPELFDALGLVRTEELRLAGRYYGLDDQYFTTTVDYGYSKTLEEALRSWDREAVLGDMVRIIRRNRPLVVVSRWHGSERDGHGHHQAAGALTPEAVRAAADPARFPEQISQEGLLPWRVRRVYRGRILDGEPFHLEIDPNRMSPWLGSTYQAFGAYGLSLQRSQTSGRVRTGPVSPARYERLVPTGPDADATPFDGLDTSLSGVFHLTGEDPPRRATALLAEAQEQIRLAVNAFEMVDPGAIAPFLVLARARMLAVVGMLSAAPEAAFIVDVERRELDEALAAALGLRLEAVAVAPGQPPGTPLGPAAPAQEIDIHWSLEVSHPAGVDFVDARFESGAWTPVSATSPPRSVLPNTGLSGSTRVQVREDAAPTRPWFQRASISENQYAVRDSTELHLAESGPVARCVVRVSFAGETLELSTPVRTVVAILPYGSIRPPLSIVPPVTVRTAPEAALARPIDDSIGVTVEVEANTPSIFSAIVHLALPPGWRSQPAEREVRFQGEGQRFGVPFHVFPPSGWAGRGEPEVLRAQARVLGREYGEGYRTITHRDLTPQRLYTEATVVVVPVDVRITADLRVGYVMGVGDEVPAAIGQLGADIELLDEADLTSGDLARFHTIVVGTRAYAVRGDLVVNNGRLLDFARTGGNLVVLYQTPEYAPTIQAPYPADLPGNAEEVSEEDAAVEILAPDHPLLSAPNRITAADFDGWIEQRGSKFFAAWSPEYTALIETHDAGQAPQRGIWLTAPVGEGYFTYAALALQRQLPHGVAGAYRILANLLSLGR